MITHLCLHVPIAKRWQFDREDAQAGAQEILRELSALSGRVAFVTYEHHEYPIEIDILEEDQTDNVVARYFSEPSIVPRVYARLRSTIEYFDEDIAPWREGFEDVPNEYIVRMYLESLADDLHKRWVDLAIAANIARPGSLTFWKGVTTSDGEDPKWRGSAVHGLSSAVASARRINWPRIQTLPLAHVWEWLQKIPGFEDGAWACCCRFLVLHLRIGCRR